uniref:Protein 4.1 n=1 Tax=Neolamprologus brichardi TaxID=32507 RepID=A0A3Q4MZU9_NEOBR
MTTEATAVTEADTEGKQKTSGAEPEPEPENKQKAEAATSDPEGEQSTTSPEEEQLKPRTRTSAGKGLSRLFSSFLKRRSQCSEEEVFEAEKSKGKKEEKEVKEVKGPSEEQVKAPIAAPEPELKTEPDIEQAADQHSISSTEVQPAQEEHKEEAVIKEAEAVEEQKTMQCKVTLLDDAQFECELDKHAKGQELLTKVCDHVNLLEKDYFGLAHWETPTSKTWLESTKEIRKQVPGAVYEFTFNVKFYPPDPAQLTEDLTRYFLCLQLRKDIMGGVLPCSFVTLSLLGSYTAQSELGEYDPELHGTDYVKDLNLEPNSFSKLSMSPAQADLLFLENAKKLAMYGVDLHQAKDLDGVDIMLGVCSSGLMVYKDKLRINRFPWPKVLKISYKRSSFFIKIRPSEQEQYESTIGFKLPNYKASKKLWKVCVEHHTFFRVSTVEPPSSRRFLALGSKFRYSGRTQAQTRQASSMIDRPAPRFTRSASKRLSRNLDGAASAQRGNRPVSAPVFSQAALMEAGIPMATLDQPQTSTPIKTSCQEERKLQVTVEAVEPSKIEAGDFDKPQEVLLRHHASISELKRNFMEAVPDHKPSEWDKRLSTHSPFRTLGINGQPLPSADGPPLVQTQTVTITAVSSPLPSGISTTEVPIVPTKTFTYESSKVGDKDCSTVSSSQTITSETTSGTSVTTTTTHISKVVKSGSSETRVEKRIVITADSDIDQDKLLLQQCTAQHTDMEPLYKSLTRLLRCSQLFLGIFHLSIFT